MNIVNERNENHWTFSTFLDARRAFDRMKFPIQIRTVLNGFLNIIVENQKNMFGREIDRNIHVRVRLHDIAGHETTSVRVWLPTVAESYRYALAIEVSFDTDDWRAERSGG